MARFWSIAGITPSEEAATEKRRGDEAALAAMERRLQDHHFLVADRYTIADIALYAYTHVAREGGFELDGYPAVQTWLSRVAGEAGHIPITA